MPTPVRATTRVVDPGDEALLRAWWEVGQAATAERPLDSWPVWEVSRVALPMARTDIRLDLLVAEEDGPRRRLGDARAVPQGQRAPR